MNLRGILVAAVLGGLLPPVVAAGGQEAPADTVWTLDRCEQACLDVSPQLTAKRAEAAARRAGADAAGAGELPTVGLAGKAGYVTRTMSLEVPTPMGSRHMEFGDGTDTDLMLGVRAPLFTGGSLRAERKAAEAGWLASLADVAADSLDLRLQVRQVFYAAVGSESAAQAELQGQARLGRHLARVEDNIAAGTATEEARLQVLARIRRSEQAVAQAEARTAALRYRLGRLVGMPGTGIVPQADLDESLLEAAKPEGRPWAQRPPLEALDARLDAANRSAEAASGSLWPSVELTGGWHYGKPGIDALANDWMDYGTVSLNLQWTLFDFGGRSDRVRGLRARERALAATRDDVRDALQTRQANARTQVETGRRVVASADQRLELERRRLELAQQRWGAGHATETEILDAQDDVTLAEIDAAAARAHLRAAEAELIAALGW